MTKSKAKRKADPQPPAPPPDTSLEGKVRMASAIGLTPDEIRSLLCPDVSGEDFIEKYKKPLESGRAQGFFEIAKKLYGLATGTAKSIESLPLAQLNFKAAQFFAESRMGWKKGVVHEIVTASDRVLAAPPKQLPPDEKSKEDMYRAIVMDDGCGV